MQNTPQKTVFTYKFDKQIIKLRGSSEAYNCYKMTFTEEGNFNPKSPKFIQNTEDDSVCIIHGHTPYHFFNFTDPEKCYGKNSLFWENQHIWFSEDMRSFDIDSNIKDKKSKRENRRLSCICLEVYDELEKLTKKNIINSSNGVFSVLKSEQDETKQSIKSNDYPNISFVQLTEHKVITVNDKDEIVFKEIC